MEEEKTTAELWAEVEASLLAEQVKLAELGIDSLKFWKELQASPKE